MEKVFANVLTICLILTLSVNIVAGHGSRLCMAIDLPKVDHGHFHTRKTYFNVGETVPLNCDPGYRTHGGVIACDEHGWSQVSGGFCYKEDLNDGYGPQNLLHLAARDGNLTKVIRFYQSGYNLDEKSNQGDNGGSAIHIASAYGNLEVVIYLLSVDPSLQFDRDIAEGNLPLHSAASAGKLPVVRYFVDERRINKEEVNTKHGRTALHLASQNGHLETVEWLAYKGAKITAISNESDQKQMPIHLAAWSGHLQVVKHFIGRSCNLKHATDANGNTPQQLAEIAARRAIVGSRDVVEYLKSVNCQPQQPIAAGKSINDQTCRTLQFGMLLIVPVMLW